MMIDVWLDLVFCLCNSCTIAIVKSLTNLIVVLLFFFYLSFYLCTVKLLYKYHG